MFSVLIPAYNADCLPLIACIHKQAQVLKMPFEIILADDASDIDYRKHNSVIEEWEHCRYFQMESNVGPAVLRNFLASKASYDYLLFLDTDTMPVRDSFLSEYLKVATRKTAVCGGFTYQGLSVPPNAVLRYKYGSAVEEQSAICRKQNPYQSFISMNFLIDKSSFACVRFDEKFHLGYEDTQFGMRLKLNDIAIMHIDNPVYHKVNETCDQYLKKIERAVANLIGHEEELKDYVKLLRWWSKVRDLRLQTLIATFFEYSQPIIRRQLKGKKPSLKLFAFYKLGYLCLLKSKQ